MKRLAMMFAVTTMLAVGQTTGSKTNVPPSQVGGCPVSSMSMVFLFTIPTISLNPVCVNLDPAGFVLDTSTTPYTLRVATISTGPPTFVDKIIPTGAINGVNSTFLLPDAPNPPASVTVVRNGIQVSSGIDFKLSGATVTFFPGAIPVTGDKLYVSYRK